jgi:hypothetical protein
MSRKLRKPGPRIAGSALRTFSAVAGMPVVDGLLAGVLRKQLGIEELLEASFAEDEPPFTLPRALTPIRRSPGGKRR